MRKARFQRAAPYADDALNLPVHDVSAAIPFYETRMGFVVASREDGRAVLSRDDVQIGLAENGGDPTQEGCFFQVDDVAAAFEEIQGRAPSSSDFRMDKHGETTYKVFFVIAPDGLCYMIGERQ